MRRLRKVVDSSDEEDTTELVHQQERTVTDETIPPSTFKRLRYQIDDSDDDDELQDSVTGTQTELSHVLTNTQSTNSSDEIEPVGWNCKVCTLFNTDVSSNACEVCGSRRPSIRKSQSLKHAPSISTQDSLKSLVIPTPSITRPRESEERNISEWLNLGKKQSPCNGIKPVRNKKARGYAHNIVSKPTLQQNNIISLLDESEDEESTAVSCNKIDIVNSDDDVFEDDFPAMRMARKEKQFQTSTSSNKNIATNAHRKTTMFSKSRGTVVETTQELWVTKYKPNSVEELTGVLNKQKIVQLEQWIQQATGTSTNGNLATRFLILHGASGVGKSTAIRVICKSLNVTQREWQADILRPYSATYWDATVQDKFSKTSSQLRDFAQFTRQVRYTPLQLVPADGKSHTYTNNTRQMLIVEMLPHLHNSESQSNFHNILWNLVRDLEADERMRQRQLGSHNPQVCKTAIVFVHTCESEASNPRELINIFSENVINHPLVTSIEFKQVTSSRIRKRLTQICGFESRNLTSAQLDEIVHGSSGDLRHAIHSAQFVCGRQVSNPGLNSQEENLWQKVKSISKKRPSRVSSTKKGSQDHRKVVGTPISSAATKSSQSRDSILTMNHAVGRLLYAKRHQCGQDGVSTLENVPEEVVDNCPLPPDAVSAFVHHNMYNFFQDLDDVQNAMEVFSLSDSFMGVAASLSSVNGSLLNKGFNLAAAQIETQAGMFPQGYVSSLVSWIPAIYNKHPASGKFVPITKPEQYGLRNKQLTVKENLQKFVDSIAGDNVRIRRDFRDHALDKSLLESISNPLRRNNAISTFTEVGGVTNTDIDIEIEEC